MRDAQPQSANVFLVSHPNWGALEVEQCCGKLTSEIASEFSASPASKSSKLKRFVSSSRWKRHFDGSHRITQARLDIRVVPIDAEWFLVLDGR